MAPKKSVEVEPGEILAIPLFATDIDELKRFTKKDHADPNHRYAFARVVEDRGGSGIICEIFDRVGPLGTSIDDIVAADRLFAPVAVSGLGIHKKRWVRMGRQNTYDRERDSSYSRIALVLSPFDQPVLWQGGKKIPISNREARQYEPWTIWGEQKLEKRIAAALNKAT